MPSAVPPACPSCCSSARRAPASPTRRTTSSPACTAPVRRAPGSTSTTWACPTLRRRTTRTTSASRPRPWPPAGRSSGRTAPGASSSRVRWTRARSSTCTPSSSRTPTGRSSGSASARRNDVAGCARRRLLLGYPGGGAGRGRRQMVTRAAGEELPGVVLDIDGLTSQQVVDLVLRRTGWPDGAGPP